MADTAFQEEDYTKRLDWAVWKRIFARAFSYRQWVAPLIVISLSSGVLDSLFNLVTRGVIDEVAKRGVDATLVWYALEYGGLVAGLVACIWLFIVLAGRVATQMSHDFRQEAFARLQDLSFSYYDTRPAGWLMARMTSDSRRLSDIIAWGLLDMVWGTTLMVCIAGLLLWMNWKLGLAVLAVVPILAWVSLAFQKAILASSRLVRKTNSRLTDAFNEAINGVSTTKVLVREEQNLSEFQGLSTEMYDASLRNAIQSALYLPIVLTISSVGVAAALYYGGMRAAVGGLSVGTLIAFIGYARQFFDPISQMARIFSELQHAQASAERLFGLIDTVPEIRDSPEVLQAIETHRGADPLEGVAEDGLPDRIETLEFENLSFAYKEGEEVLKDFSLKVRAGQRIALVGPTGGGKTTIVSLLCRFYEPTQGRILIDGVDYRHRALGWLQSKLGIVLQTPHLFSGTIRENIRYGRLDAADEEIEQAARLADAHDFIMALENGYDSRVDKEGANFSTGQKQLLSFARAIAADPWILVMDEATSSVDTQTERRIQRALTAVLEGRTSFVIAHRLSTIRSADLILVIENGRIAEQGAHHDLLRRRGAYYNLYADQFRHERETEELREAVAPAVK
ncbi:MAG: ABC transporter ATP-binding protein [Candidatus Sumerlaeota bacterium]|nr:ABC transporter ATP-binding protein [Candidatus Sumerlaeota bacterium]